ncbi:MAG: glutathione synthase [Gammaproteobacteria bacterium]|nr:glutathione synthase [Gammaproteobacteria bacterium]MCP5200480.1 glutathione synthase [Gammaproteobacteria bacterium]
MTRRLGVIMDPIAGINPKKDTTLALLLAATRAGFALEYIEMGDLVLVDGRALAHTRPLVVHDSLEHWFDFGGPRSEQPRPLGELDCILMRKDPPFDMEFVFATYMLERAQADGALVVNDPRSIRDASEKLFTAWFAELCPPTLVTRNKANLRSFLAEHGDIVVKPLDGMGGASVFRVQAGDGNTSVIFETLTELESRYCMAQRYLPAILDGDKRVLVVDGEPVPYALARIPGQGELRGNLAAGGRGVAQPLSAADRAICARVAPELRRRGLLFVGLDVIGDRLTEINVTSPTCVREIEAAYDIDIGGLLMAAIERRLATRSA